MISIDLSHIEQGLSLEIIGEPNTYSIISDEEVILYGEAKYQLSEGCSYEYQFSDPNYNFKSHSKRNSIIIPSRFGKHKGLINPNIFVGTHTLEIENYSQLLPIEVRSVKAEYRSDYRFMLESITERCTDLIMQIDAPINQQFETDFNKNPETLYQRFSFVKSLIDSQEFEEAIQRIVSNPATKWQEEHEEKDIRSVRRFNQKNIKQIVTKSNRTAISSDHYLNKNFALTSVPLQIESKRKVESINTAENRFIKHALEEFLFFCENCEMKFEKYSTAKTESGQLAAKISLLLNQSFFKEVSRPTSLKLNSPVLQRKSGYREVLNAWLKFDLAAKLIWHGGDNVYEAGKKDIATLYEYWLFFALLDLLKEVFEIEPKSIAQLIQFDKEHLSLNLKQGSSIALKGIYQSPFRNLNIQFSYNRSFGGGKKYPNSGSYTTTLRPDYTLSIWPAEIKDAKEAELKELITHIHFDAKYKVNNFYDLISASKNDELDDFENGELIKEEQEEIKKGTFKNQDLLKMHAYKDAIRRTSGAYVLYPGDGKNEPFRGFHELIPGLGAFVIKPNNDNKDKVHLKSFIKKVVYNFIDRASQREHIALKVYDIHKKEKKDFMDDDATPNILMESMPEYLDKARNEKLIPDVTFVIVGFYKSKEQLEWILKNNLYNFRTGTDKGSLPLSNENVNAKYLILHSSGELITDKIYQLKTTGPKILSQNNLIKKDYPNPSGELYLVYEIEKEVSEDFQNVSIDIRKLSKFESYRNSAKPLTSTLTEILKAKAIL